MCMTRVYSGLKHRAYGTLWYCLAVRYGIACNALWYSLPVRYGIAYNALCYLIALLKII
jgi:hypothetical protein